MKRTDSFSLDVTMLGTGGAFTDFRENYHNNMAVRTRVGVVLIDCGGTAVQSLKEIGVHPSEISGVVITHMHGDHVGGLEQLIWERHYTGPGGGPPLYLRTRIICPLALKSEIEKFLEPCIREYTRSDGTLQLDGLDKLLEWVDLDPCETYESGGVSFTFFKVPHCGPKDTFGVRIGGGSSHIIYTSDTTYREEEVSRWVSEGAEAVFHDCTFSPLYKGTVHTHFEQLMNLSPDVKRRVILMHHTKVPSAAGPHTEGFLWAAARHDRFMLSKNSLRIIRGNGDQIKVLQPGTLGNDGEEVLYHLLGVPVGLV